MNLTDELTRHLHDVAAPRGSLAMVVHRGREIRRRRRRLQGAAAAALALVVVGTAMSLGGWGPGPSATDDTPLIATAPMDFGNGLRAYASPDGPVSMGGRTFDGGELDALDTDAAATAYGVVYYSDGRPYLLGEDGASTALWDGPVESVDSFRPTAKMDRGGKRVAFAVADGGTTLVVRDLATGVDFTSELDCGAEAGCDGLVVEGIDSGTVFVRTDEGTYLWDYADPDATTRLRPFAGPKTRVADVRNGVVLHTGPAPEVPGGWRPVAGQIDAQLTFDGRHVLYWSDRLEPTTTQAAALRLQTPEPATFFAMDTDGTVLAATVDNPSTYYDCVLPSGRCQEIGQLKTTSGDPIFMGNDM